MIELDYDTTINFTIFENQYNTKPIKHAKALYSQFLTAISKPKIGAKNSNNIDLTGYTFHGCTVLRPAIGKRKSTAWYCECVCGKEFILTTASLRSGRPQSCGCKGNIIRPKLK